MVRRQTRAQKRNRRQQNKSRRNNRRQNKSLRRKRKSRRKLRGGGPHERGAQLFREIEENKMLDTDGGPFKVDEMIAILKGIYENGEPLPPSPFFQNYKADAKIIAAELLEKKYKKTAKNYSSSIAYFSRRR